MPGMVVMGKSHGWGPHCLPIPSLLFPYPTQSEVPNAAAHRAPQTALPCPLEAIPKVRAFIYLLKSPGWASGCSKGRRISRKMVPGDDGRCHHKVSLVPVLPPP